MTSATMTTSERIRRHPRLQLTGLLPVDLGAGAVRDTRYLPVYMRYLLELAPRRAPPGAVGISVEH